MTSIYRNSVLLFFSAILVRLVFHFYTGFTADDAFITFRYAENLALGDGFVYNNGQAVFGSSTPLFVLLLSIFSLMTINPLKASMILSLAASGMTAVVIYRLARNLRFTNLAVLPSWLYIFSPRSIPAETCGMETALFSFFSIAAFYCEQKKYRVYALGAATLASVTRYEGFLVLLILITYYLFTDRDRIFKYLLIPSLIIIPWIIFTYFYFGSVVPNSITAKLALYKLIETDTPWDHFKYLLGLYSPFGWVLFMGSVYGAVWLNKKQNYGWLEICWFLSMIIFFTFSRTNLFFWYVAPLYPVYLLFFGAGLKNALEKIERVVVIKKSSLIITVFASTVLAFYLIPVAKAYRYEQQLLDEVHHRIGDYLYVYATNTELIAAEDIGYIGYYSRKKILDRDGLISPAVIPYNKNGEYLKLILDTQPDWVVLYQDSPISVFYDDRLFTDLYSNKAEFESESGLKYIIFKKY